MLNHKTYKNNNKYKCLSRKYIVIKYKIKILLQLRFILQISLLLLLLRSNNNNSQCIKFD